MNKSANKSLLSIAAVAVALIGTVSANADDKILPGNSCVVLGGTVVQDWSFVRNESTTAGANLLCPVPVDSTDTQIAGGWVMYLDRNNNASGGSVSCALTSVYHAVNGDLIFASQGALSSSSSGSSTTWQKFTFGIQANNPLSTVYYACGLPNRDLGASAIGEYMVDE